ncbi:MAG TPA: IPExxxVDY family protein [Flavobacteriales bacterium]|nr:IPExxxVDY family protein [Flavobacteriales bacterium]
MAKFTLDEDDDALVDFLLIGISSHAKIYRLCWSLNQVMRLKLANTNKPIEIIDNRKKIKLVFDVYNYPDEETRIDFYLMPNKHANGFLLPELKHIDYLMMLKENLLVNTDDVIGKLRLSDQVLTAFEINTQEVRSIENLLF